MSIASLKCSPEPDASFRGQYFPHRITERIRFADLDPNNHVNNAIFVSLFEMARVSIMRDPALGLMPNDCQWVVAHVAVDYKREVGWPGEVEIATGIRKIGRTSLTFEQVLQNEHGLCASATTVSVLVSKKTKTPSAISSALRARLAEYVF